MREAGGEPGIKELAHEIKLLWEENTRLRADSKKNADSSLGWYNQTLALQEENDRLRKALERAVTYIELTCDETDGEEAAEARHDLEMARHALGAVDNSEER